MERWPDVVPAVIAHLSDSLWLTAGRVATKVPSNVETLDGFVRVARGPGSDDEVSDNPIIDVETFTPASTTGAWALAENARQAMHALGGIEVRGVLIDSVRTATAPMEVDYKNPKIVRYVASYRFSFRKVV